MRDVNYGGKALKIALRLGLAAGLLAFLFAYFDPREILKHLTSVQLQYVLLAVLILGAQFLLSSLRWWVILRRLRIPVEVRRALSIFGVGALANLVLVTSLAGISVRALLLMRSGIRASAALGALVVERAAAVVGLLLCLCAGLVCAFPLLWPSVRTLEVSKPVVIAAVLALGVGLGGLALLTRYDAVRRFVNQLRGIGRSRRAIVELAASSLFIVLAGFVAVAALARGMHIDVDTLGLIAVLPFVAIISALPISVGGWGVREGSMVAGLGLVGVQAEQAIALSIIYGLVGVLVTVILGFAATMLWERRVKDALDDAIAAHAELPGR